MLPLLLCAGCAAYRPQPLDSDFVAAALRSPDRGTLLRDASRFGSGPAARMTLDLDRPLDAEETAVIAVLTSPELRAQRAAADVAQAQVFAAGLLPDPQLGLGFDRVLAPASEATAYTGSLAFDLFGALAKRPAAQQAAAAAAQQVRLDLAWQEFGTAAQAQILATRLGYQRAAARLAGELAEQTARRLQTDLPLAQRGDLGAAALQTDRLAALDAAERARAVAKDAAATRLELLRLLGLAPTDPQQFADPPALEPLDLPTLDTMLAQALEQRLDLQALRAGYDSQEAAVRKAVLGQYPRVGLTLNRARDTSRVHTFGPALTLDLPLWNRNRGEIAVTRAEREHLRAEYAVRLQQTRADLAALLGALARDEAARLALASELPPLQRSAEAMQHAAAAGDLTGAAAEAARAGVLDKQLAALALAQACAEQRIGLRLASGAALFTRRPERS